MRDRWWRILQIEPVWRLLQSVHVAAALLSFARSWGQRKSFLKSERQAERNILIPRLWCSVKTSSWDYSESSLCQSEALVKDTFEQGKCFPLVFIKWPGLSYQCNSIIPRFYKRTFFFSLTSYKAKLANIGSISISNLQRKKRGKKGVSRTAPIREKKRCLRTK